MLVRISNQGERQHIDVGGAGAQQRLGTAFDGWSRGEHIVDQNISQPRIAALPSGDTRNVTLDVGDALVT